MNSGSVDLIYLDPPFNSNQNYAAPIGSEAAGAAFKDSWTWDDVDRVWLSLLDTRQPVVHAIVEAVRLAHSGGMAAYVAMMAQRLVELRRLLKPQGAIYLHCDPTASHYLKALMDGIFGRDSFRNELAWKRTSSHSDAQRYASVSDRLLFYAPSGATWQTQHLPLSEGYVSRDYRHEDRLGRYRVGDLTGQGLREGESGEAWRDFDPSQTGRHWAVPRTGRYAAWIERNVLSGYRSIESIHARLDALEAHGLIDWTKNRYPRLKRYLAGSKGEAVSDFVADIQNVNNRSKEWVGYPTQKPLALLRRIITASSNEGDVVLDPFCGCATACVAAEELDRQWVGIDISHKAAELVRTRLQRATTTRAGGPLLSATVIHRTDAPKRTDLGKLPRYTEHKDLLYGQQDGKCGGCGVRFPKRNLTVDHVVPTSKGGTDHVDNLWLLCGACNSSKGTKSQAEFLRDRMRGAGLPWLEGQ